MIPDTISKHFVLCFVWSREITCLVSSSNFLTSFFASPLSLAASSWLWHVGTCLEVLSLERDDSLVGVIGAPSWTWLWLRITSGSVGWTSWKKGIQQSTFVVNIYFSIPSIWLLSFFSSLWPCWCVWRSSRWCCCSMARVSSSRAISYDPFASVTVMRGAFAFLSKSVFLKI